MNRYLWYLIAVLLCILSACMIATGPDSDTSTNTGPAASPGIGTESGDPRSFGLCKCQSDADCDGAFEVHATAVDAQMRVVQCSPDTELCRAVLETSSGCYVNLAESSRGYDCILSDAEIFLRSASDLDRPADVEASGCEP
jgi:hypothetical protein